MPHPLTDEQKRQRVKVAIKLLQMFPKYDKNGKMIMKDCGQWKSVHGGEFGSSGDRKRSARSESQRLTHGATGAPRLLDFHSNKLDKELLGNIKYIISSI